MTSPAEIVVTYANIVLYAISYQLQRPVEPFLVRSLIHNNQNITSNDVDTTEEEEASNQTYGRLLSCFSFIQTIGSPLIGILLDRIGVRKTSILVYFASAASYWILANATSTTWLYLSKVPTIFQHAFLVGQATVASASARKSSDGGDKQRAVALGRMTTAYTIGATIGPALGGYLAMGDLFAGARLAIWGSILSVLLSIIFLKDRNNNSEGTEGNNANSDSKQKVHQQQQSFLQSIHKTISYLRHPTIGPLLFIKLLNGVSSSAFTTVLPLVLVNKLHLNTSQLGYFMSASSLSVAVFASFGISFSMSLVGNRSDRLATLGIANRIVSIVCFGVVVSWCLLHLRVDETKENEHLVPKEGIWVATIASIAVSISSHMHATSLTTLTTGAVSAEQRGAILGLEHGLFSLARVVGPPFGTYLLSRPVMMSKSMVESGFAGIWRVISACVIMDAILFVCLRLWSGKQEIQQMNSDECIGLTEVGVDAHNEHDHSD